jgi:hypothetical protein
MEPTTVAACDAALADLSRMLRVAYDRTDMDAAMVLTRRQIACWTFGRR